MSVSSSPVYALRASERAQDGGSNQGVSKTLPVSDTVLEQLTQHAAEAVSKLVADTMACLEREWASERAPGRDNGKPMPQQAAARASDSQLHALQKRIAELEAEKSLWQRLLRPFK